MTRATFLPTIAAAASTALLLSGCALGLDRGDPPAPEVTATATGEDVDIAIAEFYSQTVVWSGCEHSGLQCATVEAPMDWDEPGGERIELAMVRMPSAVEQPAGTVFVNPGGPGGSGVDFIVDSGAFATSAELRNRYDVVGFDPRGVGRSSAVSCHDDPADFDEYLFGISELEIGSDAWLDEGFEVSTRLGLDCLEHTGELLGFVDTVSAARDLDMLRALVGDERLNYLGYSYGTYLGAIYAEQFPEKTGRMVFDGAIDPATTSFEVTTTQAMGFESAYRAYLADCLAREGCPFGGSITSVDEAVASTRGLLDGLDASPLPAADGRRLGSSTMFTAIILPLYNRGNWPALDQLLAEVSQGETATAFLLADLYYGRADDGSYDDNSTEAFFAINCLDYLAGPDSNDDKRARAAQLADAAPLFGPQMSYGSTGCPYWPFPGTRERGPIAASGSGPILVVGTTNDPATPYSWAVSMAAQLENGHLVTYRGEGHTAYNNSNECVNSTVDDYFILGVVPDDDPLC